MTSEEIKNQVQAAINTALVEFSGRVKAVEEKLAAAVKPEDFSALSAEVKGFAAKIDAAKTELSAKIADDEKRTQFTAQVVAKEFAATVGKVGLSASPAGAASTEPTAADKFDAVLTKHFEASKSKSAAWKLAAKEDPAGYGAFLSANRKPAFEKAGK